MTTGVHLRCHCDLRCVLFVWTQDTVNIKIKQAGMDSGPTASQLQIYCAVFLIKEKKNVVVPVNWIEDLSIEKVLSHGVNINKVTSVFFDEAEDPKDVGINVRIDFANAPEDDARFVKGIVFDGFG